MTAQLMTAINNRDGDAMARMATGGKDPQKLINIEAERLVDALFRQLKQIFPASTQTNLRTDAEEKTAKRQWIAAFSENGIRTREQLSAACVMRDPASHHSGHHRVSSSSGAKTAAQCWGLPLWM